MDIGSWLRGLELQQYEAAFRDNAIDAETLPDLTETDLEKLGVLLGHRKRILRAIEALPAAAPAAAASGPGAERRSPFPHPPLPGLVPGITGEERVRGKPSGGS